MFSSLGHKAFKGIFQRKPTLFAYIVLASFVFEVTCERYTDTVWENANQGKLMHHVKHAYGKWADEEP